MSTDIKIQGIIPSILPFCQDVFKHERELKSHTDYIVKHDIRCQAKAKAHNKFFNVLIKFRLENFERVVKIANPFKIKPGIGIGNKVQKKFQANAHIIFK